MENGTIDLHARQNLIRIVTSEGTVVLERTIPTRRTHSARCLASEARLRVVSREQHGERVGGAVSGAMWPRGGGRRSQLRADVWPSGASHQNASAGRGDAGRSQSPRALSRCPSGERRAAAAATHVADPRAPGADAHSADQSAAGATAPRVYRLPSSRPKRRGALSPPAGPRGVNDDAGAGADHARDLTQDIENEAARLNALTDADQCAAADLVPRVGPISALTFRVALEA